MITNRFVSAPLTILFTGSLAALGAAQTAVTMRTVNLSHPVSGPNVVTGNAQAVVVGQLTDDPIPDAVVQHGTSDLFFKSATDRRNRWQKIAGSHASPALLPKALSATRDGILTVGPSGLQKLIWNGSASVNNLVSTSIAGTSAWIGCKDLQVVAVPGGGHQIMAIASNNQKILRATWNSATAAVSPIGSLLVPPFVENLRGLEWNSNSDRQIEYATTNSSGLRVFGASGNLQSDVAGSLVYSLNDANTGSLLVVDPDPNPALPSGVAWVRSNATTTDYLTRVTQSGPQAASPWFGGLNVQRIVLADVGGDSRKELIALCEGFATGLGVARAASSNDFEQAAPYLLDLDRANSIVQEIWDPTHPFASGTGAYGAFPALGMAPVPAVMDLDGDTDDDLFLAGHPGSAGRSIVYLGAKMNEEKSTAQDLPSALRPWHWSYGYKCDTAASTVMLRFTQLPVPPTSGPAASATDMVITIWGQDNGSDFAKPEPLKTLKYSLTANGPWDEFIDGVDINSGENCLLHLEFAFSRKQTQTGEVLTVYPAYHETIETRLHPTDVFFNFVQRPDPLDAVGGTGGGTPNRPPVIPPSTGP